MATATKEDTDQVIRDFKAHVNMTASALEKWLETDESKSVGWKGENNDDENAESVGHESGRRIVELLGKKKADYDEADIAHLRKVNSYIARHSAQRPKSDDVAHTKWTYSLKNWGHDPGKE